MTTWNYRVFRDQDGYCIREVFYLDDGTIGGCTERAVTPSGDTIEALAQDIEYLKEALGLPVLTLEEVDAAVAARPILPAGDRSQNISLDQLVAELGLEQPGHQTVTTDASNSLA
jgi:hypothetical protein